MSKFRRGLWLYPLFQIPLMLLGVFLTAALLFWLLGFGKPPVAVAIALDLSTSTYEPQPFNEPGTIMNQEIQAVQAYLNKNSSSTLKQPNQVKIFGFANGVTPLTNSFTRDATQTIKELNKNLQPNLPNTIGGGTDLDLAIQEGIQALESINEGCRELLIVTDGEALVDPRVVTKAIASKVRINAIIIGTDAPAIQAAVISTGGKYLSGEVNELSNLFTKKLFDSFNNNWRWVLFWLGLAWIALMWVIVMPLDRWLFQGLLNMPLNLAGRLALGNALFWTTLTPVIVWRIYQVFNWVLPFLSSC